MVLLVNGTDCRVRNAWSSACISAPDSNLDFGSRVSARMTIPSTSAGMFSLSWLGGRTSALRTFSSVEKSLSPWNRRSPVRLS